MCRDVIQVVLIRRDGLGRGRSRDEGLRVIPTAHRANAPVDGRYTRLEVHTLHIASGDASGTKLEVGALSRAITQRAVGTRHIHHEAGACGHAAEPHTVQHSHETVVHVCVNQRHVRDRSLITQANRHKRHQIGLAVLCELRGFAKAVLVQQHARLWVHDACPPHERHVREAAVLARDSRVQSMLH